MDSYNYFNELSSYNQARQLFETYQADKDQLKEEESGLGGTVGLASASELLSKSLSSESIKSSLIKLLKTGNSDVDTAVENTIKGITSETNPLDIVSSLTSQLKPVLAEKASDLVQSALAKVTGRNKPLSDLFGSEQPRVYSSINADPQINQTFQNPAFEDEGLLDGVDATEEATSGVGRLLNMGRSAIGNVLDRVGVNPDEVVGNLTNRVTSLAHTIQQRASGVAEDVMSRGQQALSDAQQLGNGILEDARTQVTRPLNLTRVPRDELPFPEAEPEEANDGIISRIASQARNQIDVAMARANPSGSTSNQIGDMLKQGNIDIGSTADAESSQIGSNLENLASTGRSLIDPAIADIVPDSLESVVAPATSAVTDALSGITGGVSDALLGASSVEEGVGAALDSTGVLAPIGALLGLLGIGGSLAGMLDHHASKPSFGGAQPVFEPGI